MQKHQHLNGRLQCMRPPETQAHHTTRAHLIGHDVPQSITGQDDAVIVCCQLLLHDIRCGDDVALQRPVTKRSGHSQHATHTPGACPHHHTACVLNARALLPCVGLVINGKWHSCTTQHWHVLRFVMAMYHYTSQHWKLVYCCKGILMHLHGAECCHICCFVLHCRFNQYSCRHAAAVLQEWRACSKESGRKYRMVKSPLPPLDSTALESPTFATSSLRPTSTAVTAVHLHREAAN